MLGKDDFIIDSKILGDGAYAKVYSGLRKRDKEPVAIKVMDKAQCNSSSFVNIQLEIEIMSALNHPNIVNMQASWETDHETYVVLDYCRGGELFKYMKKYDLSHMPEVAPQFVGEIVLALEYLRKLKVLHRDLKPENILLTADFHVKLADFGTACWAEKDDEDSKKFTGTAQYMAPEMFKETKDGGCRAGYESDLWALGCVVFQLFCGRPPFTGQTAYLIFKSISDTVLEYPPFVPAEARSFIERLLIKDKPTQRLGSESCGGFTELKAHRFFMKVDWEHINEKTVTSHVDHNHSADWKKFLLENEEVLYAGETIKTRRMLSKKKRILILTNFPRLFYIEDKEAHKIKKHVPWCDDIVAKAKTKCDFDVVTKGRTYNFEDPAGHAHLWVSKINQVANQKRPR